MSIKVSDFQAIKLKLASPEEILTWSHGEVTKTRNHQLPNTKTGKRRLVLLNKFLGRKKTGNVIAANTDASDTKALFAINAALR